MSRKDIRQYMREHDVSKDKARKAIEKRILYRVIVATIIIGLVLAAGISIFLVRQSTQKPQPEPITTQNQSEPAPTKLAYTEAEGLQLVNELLAAVNPALPENFYFPPWVRERILWIFHEDAQNTLLIRFVEPFFNTEKDVSTLIRSNFTTLEGANQTKNGRVYKLKPGKKHVPFIEIRSGRLMVLVRLQQKTKTGFSQMMKDTFALLLAHEAEHLQRGEEWFTARPHTRAEHLLEEVRAMALTVLKGTRPMRAVGLKLELDLNQADDILRSCQDNPKCPEFQAFVERHAPNAPEK